MGDDKSRALNKLAELPAILPEAEEAWAAVLERGFQPRMQAALQRVAAGESVPDAGRAEGYSSFTDIYRHSKACGLIDLRTDALIDINRSIAHLSGMELMRRLLHSPKDISTHALAVTSGINTDKVLKAEERSKPDGANYISALEAANKLIAEGGSIELTVTVRPAGPTAVTLEPIGETITISAEAEPEIVLDSGGPKA